MQRLHCHQDSQAWEVSVSLERDHSHPGPLDLFIISFIFKYVPKLHLTLKYTFSHKEQDGTECWCWVFGYLFCTGCWWMQISIWYSFFSHGRLMWSNHNGTLCRTGLKHQKTLPSLFDITKSTRLAHIFLHKIMILLCFSPMIFLLTLVFW